ncbi:bifunctional DNA-binding transcriptional regulator/O6-methylguanine-DNA methyltransferase Ada [Roseomonas xinghualingensis]|uniref:bifunctional DNA-binding transcriptional regulator/O6-methylguanine-DNA methyltransferase Ada n=1 Tax=Roseomonas xinghualingensis TaxID=2986475 RepID=UPI0021F11EC8|nr:bifunctional DNA-binding transcriptional regulator/O6-methylguanine-DNA methyltransferase Ada [Roseomonas sp. SXEYE001]MCV4206663.1 bifunctional DNA-binding transcriptional regulator/O6-methylguanine-DNA methyltransferase Ada [Roseomonas sp. SXEYE001]
MNVMTKPQPGIRAERDPRWAALTARDPAAEGSFFYSVRTTGVYCRPSCAARRPNPRNIRFHATAAEAEAAGFRPCRRCRPDEASPRARQATLVAEACRMIETAEEPPSLSALAEAAGLSPHHFHRVFRAVTGLTPKAYAAAHRARRVRDALERRESVTEAIYGAGFNASSRFYEAADGMLGMTPSDYRAGGTHAEIRFAVGQCSLGAILVARSERGVCAILLGDDPDALLRDLQDRFPRARLIGGDAEFEAMVARVVGFVEAPGIGLELPLDLRGTAFQQRVWQALREIPPGETVTYAEIARRIGAPQAVRAVGTACGANAIAVAIPCHRVLRSDGGRSGYRWGIERKRDLLAREKAGAG